MITTATRLHTDSFGDDEIVINYHDAVIYGSDLKLFEQRSAWLNDACIHFVFTWLQQKRCQREEGAAASTAETDTVFLDPAVISFVMHQCSDDEDVDDFLSGNNNFDTVQRIFLPINDMLGCSQWTVPGGGSHWSLLIIILPVRQDTDNLKPNVDAASYNMWHFDSIRGNNIATGKIVAAKFQQILDHAAEKRGSKVTTQDSAIKLVECKTPQQSNGYDCGVHMLVAAEELSELTFAETTSLERCEQVLRNRVTPQTCSEMRLRIAREIRSLHKNTLE